MKDIIARVATGTTTVEDAHELERMLEQIELLRAEVHALREALAALVSWFPSADTYLRLGFDPLAPMEALEKANVILYNKTVYERS